MVTEREILRRESWRKLYFLFLRVEGLFLMAACQNFLLLSDSASAFASVVRYDSPYNDDSPWSHKNRRLSASICNIFEHILLLITSWCWHCVPTETDMPISQGRPASWLSSNQFLETSAGWIRDGSRRKTTEQIEGGGRKRYSQPKIKGKWTTGYTMLLP